MGTNNLDIRWEPTIYPAIICINDNRSLSLQSYLDRTKIKISFNSVKTRDVAGLIPIKSLLDLDAIQGILSYAIQQKIDVRQYLT